MGVLDSIKKVFTVGDEYDDSYDEVEDTESYQEDNVLPLKPKFVSNNSDNIRKIENSYTSKDTKVIIYEPKEYSEATNIVDSLRNKKIVVVNFANMKENKEEGKSSEQCQKEIFDFINGAVYAINGNIRKIEKTIFVIAPPSVDIDSNISQEFERKGSHKWAI